MSCSNCFNGCVETTSDKCIKYTGIDVPVLGIKNGDSLSYIEQALIEFLTSTLDGTGIILDIPEADICNAVKTHLDSCKDLTILDLSIALIKATCDIQLQVTAIREELNVLNADYTIGCLTGVVPSSDTHTILQTVITKLCTVDSNLTALSANIIANYVAISDIDTYIASYLNSISATTLISAKMIPWVAMEYYGPITGFDVTGKGTGNWDKVYLCNGNNSTPDKRGRVAVGVTSGMGGPAMNPIVDPADPSNPEYSLLSIPGTNIVTLGISQIPSHNHTGSTAATVISPNPHSHTYLTGSRSTDGWSGDNDVDNLGPFSSTTGATLLTATTNLTIANQGGAQGHSNVQPGIGCYYIIYIP